MDERQQGGLRRLDLLAAHCRSLDPEAPTARERLEQTLGQELSAKLLFALAPRSSQRRAA
ncbi:MAG TPA: hypothetical protein VFJ91_04175 [Gaiellaceae bacterium]|jgi:hypothetical protein|nr:hypothetical protein [Gaiellaceae bacterium]